MYVYEMVELDLEIYVFIIPPHRNRLSTFPIKFFFFLIFFPRFPNPSSLSRHSIDSGKWMWMRRSLSGIQEYSEKFNIHFSRQYIIL